MATCLAFDPFAGRKVYHWLYRAGLKDIRAHMLVHTYIRPRRLTRQLCDGAQVRDSRSACLGRFGGRATYERWVERFLAMFEDPSAFTYSGLFSVEGTVAA